MIPEPVMRELRYIEVYTAKRIRNLRVGPYTSPLRGPGFDFDEHRPYRQGDDVRRIDWNVTARMDAPYVRHTHAERELNVVIVIDASRSMDLGTADHSKKELMTYITASLLFSAVSDQINTGFLAFADRVLDYAPPRPARASTWAILERCWAAPERSRRTAMLPAIRHMLTALKGMSVIFIVSDFITDEDLFASGELAMLAARHDVVAVVPHDPIEDALPEGRGYMSVRDVESGRQVAVALSPGRRRAYAADMRSRREALARAFYRLSMDHVFVPTVGHPGSVAEPLLALFARRVHR